MQHTFGAAVERLRKQKDMTLRSLAWAVSDLGVKIDASGIKRIETGEREPRLSEAVAISQALGVGLGLLTQTAMSDENRAFTAITWLGDALEVLLRSAAEFLDVSKQIDDLFYGLPAEQKKRLKSYIRSDLTDELTVEVADTYELAVKLHSALLHPSRSRYVSDDSEA